MSRPIRFISPLPAGLLVSIFSLIAFLLPYVQVSAQCTLVCNQSLTVSLDDAGQVTISPTLLLLGGGSACPGPFEVKLRTAQGVLLPNPLTCSHVGQPITATVRHLATGNSCTTGIVVQDALPPTLSCPAMTLFCGQEVAPSNTGLPSMTDNCTPAAELDRQYIDTETDFDCATVHAGSPVVRRFDRRWMVTDESGNSTTCVQQIWVRRPTAEDVMFPPNRNGFALPSLDCSEDPNDLDLTGQPTVGGQPIANGNFCEIGIGYEDQIISACAPAGYSVLRTWILIEFCGGVVTQRQQLIQVEDKTPPVVTTPANRTVGTSGNQCDALVTLSAASATDDCSAVTIAPVWEYGQGFGPFANVPLGSHVVTYVATDACGNSASTTAVVTVVDNSPPTVVCSGALQLSLGSNGMANLYATALNGGSYDQCGGLTLAISRDGVTYASSLVVTCADLPNQVPVTLRVRDEVGLDNFCVSHVTVRDFLKPTLVCPANATLTCRQDYHDLFLTGTALATDNCTLHSLDSTHTVAWNGCHIGLVTRAWRATDAAGNTKSCTQIISLVPINTTTVAFPADLTVNGCGSTDATAPAATGQPTLTGESCSPLSVTYTDQVFQSPPPGCYRLVRTWKVIDFCLYNPNGGTQGYWQYAQIINVHDNTPPLLSLPADMTVAVNQPGCMAQVILSNTTATDCSSTVTITHNSAYATAGVNASGIYPLGEHAVTFRATDGCGNIAQQTLHITVRDATAPTAVCATGLVIQKGLDSLTMLNVALLDGGSSDQCSPVGSLTFTALPSAFTCQQTGYQPVVLTVTDIAGNSATCQALVNVQDTADVCGTALYKVDGRIRMPTGQPVSEIAMHLTGNGFAETLDCDSLGHFAFSDLPRGSYALAPYNNAKWLNGVTTFDLLLISRHILGLQPLHSPYKMLAADANRSGSITAFDIVQLRKVILGILDTLPTGRSWRFMPANFVFADTLNPFTNAPPEAIMLTNLHEDQPNQNFIGIKVGDLNETTNFADPRSPHDTAWVELPDLTLQPGLPVAILVRLKNWSALAGFQFELAWQPDLVDLDSVEIRSSGLLNDSHVARRNDHSLAVSWDDGQRQPGPADSVVLVLHFLPKQMVNLQSVVQLQRERVAPESYPVDQASIAPLGLRFLPIPGSSDQATMQVFPNPFSQETTLAFDLPEAGEVYLSVTDVTGLPILMQHRNFSAGHQQWRIKGRELPGPGMYYCKLVSAARTFSAAAGLILGE